jgi:hypothetical protein
MRNAHYPSPSPSAPLFIFSHPLPRARALSLSLDVLLLLRYCCDDASTQGTAVGGYLSSAAKKQGLGWLMELEEDDEEDQKPLLCVDARRAHA